ncbi:hypothetical protein [Spirosoma endbachense]|uniref:Uncharacterized protein n=1 Tax=Spirosoma endbachense TaxID=2666025 RepID=A0A6P1VZX0_9BACT|nr:hypothetical protein [Spirosoma endbachense]QHV97320.1 hypothetical protein GJR95_20935 [Spirosoma endbachense]
MESINLHQLLPVSGERKPARATRRKVNGPATAALLIKMATEILTASPTLRHQTNITLTDLAAAEKVRKALLKTSLK